MQPLFARRMPALLTPDECTTILSNLPDLHPSRVVDPNGGPAYRTRGRTCFDGWLRHTPEWDWLFGRLSNAISLMNAAEYQLQIERISALQVLRYRPFQWFGPHFDSNSDNTRRRKLTLVVQLSKPTHYLGGNLTVFGSPKKAYRTRTQGDGILFPSHTLHMASPVLLGTRYALVAWMEGPPLR